MTSVVIDSRDPLFAACGMALKSHADTVLVAATNPRDAETCRVHEFALGKGHVTFENDVIDFEVHEIGLVPTESRAEMFRRLTLRCDSSDAISAFVKHALSQWRDIVNGHHDKNNGVPVYCWDNFWDKTKTAPRRPLESLFFPEDAGAKVLHDLRHFLSHATSEVYATLHVAPIRVYLFRGIWGSGKTSLVHALASETSHGVATLSFSPGMTDRDLMAAFRQVPTSTFLVLEDVDALFDGRQKKSGHQVDFGAVLSALDGSCTERPLVVFLTTNFADRLDPAIRRRVDYIADFANVTKAQARDMHAAFFGSRDPGEFDDLWDRIGGSRGRKFPASVLKKFFVKCLQAGHTRDTAFFEALCECVEDTKPAMYM